MTGVIFDFNGTLFDDSEKQDRAWRDFAKRQFGIELSYTELRTYIYGRNNAVIMEYLNGKPLSEEEIDILVEMKESSYRRLCREDLDTFHLMPGAVELLDRLKQMNIPRTIATASRKPNVDFYIESFGLEKWFDCDSIIYDNGSIPGKPNPDYYLLAAKAIGLPPKECIVFEDAYSGIQAAYRAGAGKIVALAPNGGEDELMRITGVSEVIKDFYEFDVSCFARVE